MKRKLEFLSGRFATKEAFSKALGTGLGKTVAFKDINCYNDIKGKPCIDYNGFIVHVSITHTEHYAMSQVLLEKEINSIIIKIISTSYFERVKSIINKIFTK